MSWFVKVFGPGEPRPETFPDPDLCPHTRLLGRYRNAAALTEERPMGYKCQQCYAEFLPTDPAVTWWKRAQSVAAATEAARQEAAKHAAAEAHASATEDAAPA